jgi:hypothetical protein
MPKLLVDGNESGLDLSGMNDLSALMNALYAETASCGRVLCRVEVDGQEIDLSGEKALGELSLADVGEVSVTTGTAADLYKSGIEGALTLSDAMCADIRRSADSFRQGDFEAGLSMYMACVASMETFFQLSGAILGGFQAGAFTMAEGQETPGAPSTGTAEILGRLLEAQRGEDWTLMADVLEYEVVPNLEEWKAFLKKLEGAQVK